MERKKYDNRDRGTTGQILCNISCFRGCESFLTLARTNETIEKHIKNGWMDFIWAIGIEALGSLRCLVHFSFRVGCVSAHV